MVVIRAIRRTVSGMTRPRKLTPTLTTSIVTLLDEGNYVGTACQFVGISQTTYYAWIERALAEVERVDGDGHDSEGLIAAAMAGRTLEESLEECPDEFGPEEWPYVVFASAATRARAQAEARAVRVIKTAAMNGEWKAASWFLTHAHGRKWGAAALGVEGTPEAVANQAVTVDALEAKLLSLMPRNGGEVHG